MEAIKVVLKKDNWECINGQYPTGLTTRFEWKQIIEDDLLKDKDYILDVDKDNLSDSDYERIDLEQFEISRCIVNEGYLEFWSSIKYEFDLPLILLEQ